MWTIFWSTSQNEYFKAYSYFHVRWKPLTMYNIYLLRIRHVQNVKSIANCSWWTQNTHRYGRVNRTEENRRHHSKQLFVSSGSWLLCRTRLLTGDLSQLERPPVNSNTHSFARHSHTQHSPFFCRLEIDVFLGNVMTTVSKLFLANCGRSNCGVTITVNSEHRTMIWSPILVPERVLSGFPKT